MPHTHKPCEVCSDSGIANVGLGYEICRCIRERISMLERLVIGESLDTQGSHLDRCAHCWGPIFGSSCGGGNVPPGIYHIRCYNEVVARLEEEKKESINGRLKA